VHPYQLHDTADVFQVVRERGGGAYVAQGVVWEQQEAGDRQLKLIRADGVIRSEVEEYKRELRR
jgi:hypothetical protein